MEHELGHWEHSGGPKHRTEDTMMDLFFQYCKIWKTKHLTKGGGITAKFWHEPSNYGSVLLRFYENKTYYFWYWNFSIMHYIDQKQSEDKKNNPFKIKVFHDALVAAPPPTTYLIYLQHKNIVTLILAPPPSSYINIKIFYENNNVLTSFKWLTRFKFERSLLFCSVLQMRFNDGIDSVYFWFLPSQKPPLLLDSIQLHSCFS